MSDWVHRNGPVTITIDRGALGLTLQSLAPAVNEVAEEAAEAARRALPQAGMRRFIAVKRAGGMTADNQGVWRLRMRGRHYASGTGERLMRGVEVPVALVTNNSNLAHVWEYGAIPQPSVMFRRKGSKKVAVARATSGDHYDETYFRQWSPLLTGARAVARARRVEKYRPARGAR